MFAVFHEDTSINGTMSINNQTIFQRNVLKERGKFGYATNRFEEGGMFSSSPIGNVSNNLIKLDENISNEYNDLLSELNQIIEGLDEHGLVAASDEIKEKHRSLMSRIFNMADKYSRSNSTERQSVYNLFSYVVDNVSHANLDFSLLPDDIKKLLGDGSKQVGFGFTDVELKNLTLDYQHKDNPYRKENSNSNYLTRGTRPDRDDIAPETRRYLGFPDLIPNSIHRPQVPREENINFPDTDSFTARETNPDGVFYYRSKTQSFGSNTSNYRNQISQSTSQSPNSNKKHSGPGYFSKTGNKNDFLMQDTASGETLGQYFVNNYLYTY